jgi:hypothetical protein
MPPVHPLPADLPPLTPVRQDFPRPRLDDLPMATSAALDRLSDRIRPGQRVALAVGSRGISGLASIVGAAAAWLRARGAEPFIIPAMGSHGGASAAGQAAVLSGYGIDRDRLGVPVVSAMDTVEIPRGACPVPVAIDAAAHAADGVLLINRVKPHTDFHGHYESGLVKMAVVGLGKHRMAAAIHGRGIAGLTRVLPVAAEAVFASGKVLGGIAIVENAYDETLRLSVLPAEAILAEEPALLDLARTHMPRLPLEDIDLLLVDRLGKDVSGVGMDPNIIGRLGIRGEPEPASPRIRAIVVRDLTPDSHGNALGIGLADVITRRLFTAIDFAAMYENVYTSAFLERAKVPVVAEDDAEAVAFGLRCCVPTAAADLRIVRIRDTRHLAEVRLSPAALAARRDPSRSAVTGPAGDLFAAWG